MLYSSNISKLSDRIEDTFNYIKITDFIVIIMQRGAIVEELWEDIRN